MRAIEGVVRDAYTPVSPSGEVLEGNLKLYTGADARAAAESGPGYLIRDTTHYAPADALEQQLRIKLGIPEPGKLPPEQYGPIWEKASRDAVVDATLSRRGVQTYNDPFSLSTTSIQSRVELPWLRGLGSASGGLSVASGALNIAAATDPSLPLPITIPTIIGGSLEITGGIAYGVGALAADGAMMAAGAAVAESGGALAIPLLMWTNIEMAAENQKALQPTVDQLLREGNYLGAALLTMPLPGAAF